MLLDNERGSLVPPQAIEGPRMIQKPKRAVLVGQVWGAELAETLLEVYAPFVADGFQLEDLSRLVMESDHDDSWD